MIRRPPRSTRTDTLFPYTTLFRSHISLNQIFDLSASNDDDYGRSMPRRMTIAGQIEQLIESLEGAATCDDCITDRLNLSVRSQANAVTRDLGDDKRLERGKAPCGLGGSTKTVTQIGSADVRTPST